MCVLKHTCSCMHFLWQACCGKDEVPFQRGIHVVHNLPPKNNILYYSFISLKCSYILDSGRSIEKAKLHTSICAFFQKSPRSTTWTTQSEMKNCYGPQKFLEHSKHSVRAKHPVVVLYSEFFLAKQFGRRCRSESYL